ncbi:type III pantothenate kinase [Rhodocyclaceae bacterium SMB388]
MILLIDIGNTRIKWGLFEDGQWLREGALLHRDARELAAVVAAHAGIRSALGVNVAGPAMAGAIGEMLDKHGLRLHWFHTSERCGGVINLYDTPQQLGVDRWTALIGARSIHEGHCLVVTAGTATTIDRLDGAGQFVGGVILPGIDLMRRSLAGNTAQLPFAEGRYTTTPRNTADAIVSGCLSAQIGAVKLLFRSIEDQPDALCLLSGGGAPMLEALLDIPLRRIDNLVLRGLALIASERKFDTP